MEVILYEDNHHHIVLDELDFEFLEEEIFLCIHDYLSTISNLSRLGLDSDISELDFRLNKLQEFYDNMNGIGK